MSSFNSNPQTSIPQDIDPAEWEDEDQEYIPQDTISLLERGEKVKFEVVDRDSPDRCKANDKNGQCLFKAVQDGKCRRHMGRYATYQKQLIRRYEIQQYNHKIKHFSNDPSIKNLYDEVAILRLTLENLMNQASTPELLNIYADRITKLVGSIKDVVLACHKMDTATNTLIGKEVIFNMTQTFINIVSKSVPQELMGPIALELEKAFTTSVDPLSVGLEMKNAATTQPSVPIY